MLALKPCGTPVKGGLVARVKRGGRRGILC
jgi:hypothetical protein